MPKLYYVTNEADIADDESPADLILVANSADEAFGMWSEYYALAEYAEVNEGKQHPNLNPDNHVVFEGPDVAMSVGLIKWHSPDGFHIVDTLEQTKLKAARALGVEVDPDAED